MSTMTERQHQEASIEEKSSPRKRSADCLQDGNSSDSGASAGSQQTATKRTAIGQHKHEDDSASESASHDESGPRHWTPEENEKLREAVSRLGAKHWKKVAEFVPGRSHTQCLQRWNKVLKPGLRKGPWTKQEDCQLSNLVNRYLPEATARVQVLRVGGNPAMIAEEVNALIPWSDIAPHIPGRSIKQCRERWSYNLDPSLKRGGWSPEEDAILLETQKRIGNRWAQISRLLAGRTEHTVKTRFRSIMRARKREWKPEEDELLLRLHNEHGSRWDEIALHFPNRTKNAVNTRFKLISENRNCTAGFNTQSYGHFQGTSSNSLNNKLPNNVGGHKVGNSNSALNTAQLLETLINSACVPQNTFLDSVVKNSSEGTALSRALAMARLQQQQQSPALFSGLSQNGLSYSLPNTNTLFPQINTESHSVSSNTSNGFIDSQTYALTLLRTAELANRLSQISEQAQNALVLSLTNRMPGANGNGELPVFPAPPSLYNLNNATTTNNNTDNTSTTLQQVMASRGMSS